MYVLLALAMALIMSIAFWIDNTITHPWLRYWWVALVVAYLLSCLDVSLRRLHYRDRLMIAGFSGLVIAPAIVLFGNLFTGFLCAATLFCATRSAWYLDQAEGGRTTRVFSLMASFLIIALLALPLAINRVEIRVPNLSAGTWLTFEAVAGETPPIDARFFNRSDDHLELTTYHGTEIHAGDRVDPALRIEILRPKIVVRLLSIRYQSHVAFIDTTLSEVSGADLSALIALNQDSPATFSMDGERLLVSDLAVDEPLRIKLPPPRPDALTMDRWALAVLVRLIMLGLLGYLLASLMPARSLSIRQGIA